MKSDHPTTDRFLPDAAFFALLGLLVVAIIAVGIHLIGPAGTPATAGNSTPTALSSPVHASGTAPRSQLSRAGALGLITTYFRLNAAGKPGKACALESPAYLRSDAHTYARGSCAAQSRASLAALAQRGLVMTVDKVTLLSYGHRRARVRVTASVAGRSITQRVYLQYHAGAWWMTGGDDSRGDLGY